MSEKSDKEILDSLHDKVAFHESKLQFHQSQVVKYRKAINNLIEDPPSNVLAALNAVALQRRTFEERLIGILSDTGKALKASELQNHYMTIYGDNLPSNSFTGMVSGLIKRKGSIKNWKISGDLTRYGLPEWFEGENLKDIYK